MGTLSAAIQQIEVHPGLHHLLTLDKFNQYSRLIVHLKSDILLPQPLEESHCHVLSGRRLGGGLAT